jgi:hypothetical protein
MLGSLEVFNALVVTIEQKPESCCPVLDIPVSFMSPALEVKFRGMLFSAKARQKQPKPHVRVGDSGASLPNT